jgi:transcription initiation factor TFIIIB Brf1 subunit/transcription initiation factor TFIIB
MNELVCPKCNYKFFVHDYESGYCPNCKKAHYYWDYVLDEKTYEELFSGFHWDIDYN